MPDGGAVRMVVSHDVRIEVEVKIVDQGGGPYKSSIGFFIAKLSQEERDGLELALVHLVLIEHNGRVHVESEVGGTHFSVILPLRQLRKPVS